MFVAITKTLGVAMFGGVRSFINPFITIADASARVKSKATGAVAEETAGGPISVWPAVAFSLLVLDGQRFIIQISDPFGRGWDLFGPEDYAINWALVSTGVIAWVQTTAMEVGHVPAVAAAHDRAIDRDDRPHRGWPVHPARRVLSNRRVRN